MSDECGQKADGTVLCLVPEESDVTFSCLPNFASYAHLCRFPRPVVYQAMKSTQKLIAGGMRNPGTQKAQRRRGGERTLEECLSSKQEL